MNPRNAADSDSEDDHSEILVISDSDDDSFEEWDGDRNDIHRLTMANPAEDDVVYQIGHVPGEGVFRTIEKRLPEDKGKDKQCPITSQVQGGVPLFYEIYNKNL